MLTAYLLLLFARAIIDLVLTFKREYQDRARGGAVVLYEAVYTSTDPPLKLLRRLIPPLRVGNVALDLGFLLLVIVIIVLRGYATRL